MLIHINDCPHCVERHSFYLLFVAQMYGALYNFARVSSNPNWFDRHAEVTKTSPNCVKILYFRHDSLASDEGELMLFRLDRLALALFAKSAPTRQPETAPSQSKY